MIESPPKYALTFGMNVDRRWECGALIYNNGRLITMFERLPQQKENSA
jgi:hypothetical protein